MNQNNFDYIRFIAVLVSSRNLWLNHEIFLGPGEKLKNHLHLQFNELTRPGQIIAKKSHLHILTYSLDLQI